MVSIAAQLKSTTDGLHRQTESLMPSASLLDGTMGIEEYGTLLTKLYAVHSALETTIEASLNAYPELVGYYLPKLPWLVEDLTSLGLDPPKPPLPETEKMDTAARLIGQLYVLEGSTLGGQVILKGLKKNPTLNHLPHRYYSGYGPMTGPKWKAFMEMMENKVAPQAIGEAVRGAEEAFKAFIQAFEN